MKVTNQLVVLSALCQAVLGKPVAVSPPTAVAMDGEVEGKVPLWRSELVEIARQAEIVNAASCPPTTAPVGLPLRGLPEDSVVLASSDDEERDSLRDEVDLGWYIAHTPSTGSLTLAISSLPTVDDLLILLAATPAEDEGDEFVSLPADTFPDAPRTAMIQHTLLPAFSTHGLPAFTALLDIIQNPPPAPTSLVPDWAWRLLGRAPSLTGIARVDIMGHGLGASLGLLISLALQSAASDVQVTSTLFSLPRTGNAAFSNWVDELASPDWEMRRVTSYADTIPHLPGAQRGFTQPKKGEIWVGADPRTAYACIGQEGHESCSESIPLARTKLEDFEGPFGGVWIDGLGSCVDRFDLASL